MQTLLNVFAPQVDDFRGFSPAPTGDYPFSGEIQRRSRNLMEQLETELRVRGFSRRTIGSYIYHNREFLEFLGKKLGYASERDVKEYLNFLLENRSPETARLALSAIKFFYRNVLGIDFSYIENPRGERKIPSILTQEEVRSMIGNTKNLKHKILLELLYGCGLRVSEAAGIRVENLDKKQGILKVKGKGGKERLVPVPVKTLQKIEFLLRYREEENSYLFTSGNRDGYHLSVKSMQCIVKSAAQRAGIRKDVHPHTLRHSYATHLLEQGTDIRIIQRLLGHSSIQSTQLYTQVSTSLIKNVVSPLDTLERAGAHNHAISA